MNYFLVKEYDFMTKITELLSNSTLVKFNFPFFSISILKTDSLLHSKRELYVPISNCRLWVCTKGVNIESKLNKGMS